MFESKPKEMSRNLHPPTSPRLLQPGFHLPPPPCWLAGWLRAGETSIPRWCSAGKLSSLTLRTGHPAPPPLLLLLLGSPPPISRPLHPHSPHLVPPVHKNGPLEVGDVYPLLQLPVQGVRVGPCGAHAEVDVHSAIVMVDRVEPQDRFFFIPCFQVFQVLTSSREAISANLTLVCTNLNSTFLTPQIIAHALSPTISSSLSSAWEAIFSAG